MTQRFQDSIVWITGGGTGIGKALAVEFAKEGAKLALSGRRRDRLESAADELRTLGAEVLVVPCDVTDAAALAGAIDQIGSPQVVVHNAVGGAFGNWQQIDAETLRRNIEINTMALYHLAHLTAPAMIEAGRGALIVTGNTSALRGSASFAGFAPSKAAQRILAESLARDLGPKGVHVAYLIIDAVIDVPWARQCYHDKDDAFFISPNSIAAEVFHLAHQPKDAWSFLAEVRPYAEKW